MRRAVSVTARTGLGLTSFLVVLAAARIAPVYADLPGLPGALPLLAALVLFGALSAASATPARARSKIHLWLVATMVVAVALFGITSLRGTGGLPAEVSSPRGPLGSLAPGAIEMIGADLRGLARSRRRTVLWRGVLRAPRSGRYGMQGRGNGELEVRIDDRSVLRDAGDPLGRARLVALGRGAHSIEVEWRSLGPGPRLELMWALPESDGTPSVRFEAIPPRVLGHEKPTWWWWTTDLLAVALALLVGAVAFLAPSQLRIRPPAVRPVRPRAIGMATLAYAAVVALMSWPLARGLATTGILGQPDGRLNAWILAWGAHAISAPARLFDAPIFHPMPDALAFSENLLLLGVLGAPLTWWGGPVLTYNVLLLGSLVASGVAVFLLIRRATGDTLAAFLGGAFFAAGAPRWVNLAHIHNHANFGLPLALLALDRFWARPTLARGLLVGVVVALQGMASVYMGAITAFAVAVGVGLGVVAGWRSRELVRLGAGAMLAAAMLAPLVQPYLRMRAFQQVEFDLDTLRNYATTPESWVASSATPWFDLTRRHLDPATVRDPLFPGAVLLILGTAGLAAAPRRYRAWALTASALAFVISLGPATEIFSFFHEHLVLLRGIRNVARFSVLPFLALSVLAGLALAGRRRRTTLIALGLGLAEAFAAPIPLVPVEPTSAAASWLARNGEGAVAYLPLGADDTRVMLQSIAHFRPLVNGDSGFMPRPYSRAMELLSGPLDEDALRYLRAIEVTHVVSRDPLPLPEAQVLDGERIYDVPEGDRARAALPAPGFATLWSRRGSLVDLGESRPISRLSFEIGEGPWLSRPRVSISTDGREWEDVDARASLADATLALVRDPPHGLGEIVFGERSARFVRLDPDLPARRTSIGAARR